MGLLKDRFDFEVAGPDGAPQDWSLVITPDLKAAGQLKAANCIRIWVDGAFALDGSVEGDPDEPYAPVEQLIRVDGQLYRLVIGYASWRDNAVQLYRDDALLYRSHEGGFSDGGRAGRALVKWSADMVDDDDDKEGDNENGLLGGIAFAVGILITVFNIGGSASSLIAIAAGFGVFAIGKGIAAWRAR